MQETTQRFRVERWLFLFVSIHVIVWTLAPSLFRFNLPMDSIEGAVWGHQLDFGYEKNPFLNAWLTALANTLSHYSGSMIYCFSQLSVAICMIVVWLFAKTFLTKTAAFVAVILLEAIQYFNFHAIDFNDNVLELSLWSLIIYFFYRALRKPSYTHWLLTSVFAALGMMAKYYTALLLISLFIFLLANKDARQHLKTMKPYCACVLFLILILPHVLWLFSHDFITVAYVFDRTYAEPDIMNHLFYPAQFAWQQAQVFLPALLFFIFLFAMNYFKNEISTAKTISTFDKYFLICAGLGPFLLTLLLSLLFGFALRAGWGMPLQMLWSVLLFVFFPINVSARQAKILFANMLLLMLAFVISYRWSLWYSPDSSGNFPGVAVAEWMTNAWHKRFDTPLDYVAGDRWLAGNISFYSKDHPAVFVDWDKTHAAWMNEKILQQKGAIFIWNISKGDVLPAEIKAAYPSLIFMKPHSFSWHHATPETPNILLGLAFLPPQKIKRLEEE